MKDAKDPSDVKYPEDRQDAEHGKDPDDQTCEKGVEYPEDLKDLAGDRTNRTYVEDPTAAKYHQDRNDVKDPKDQKALNIGMAQKLGHKENIQDIDKCDRS